MGRPSKLTPNITLRICELLLEGLPRDRAAQLAGIDGATFWRWLARGKEEGPENADYREFRDMVEDTEAELQQKLIEVPRSIAFDTTAPETVRLSAAKLLLERRFPSEWGPRSETRLSGPEGGPVQVQAAVEVRPLFAPETVAEMSPEQIEAALSGLMGGGE